MEGKQHNVIANDNDLSAGAVTNIVNEWRRNLRLSIADDLRFDHNFKNGLRILIYRDCQNGKIYLRNMASCDCECVILPIQ